MKKIVIATKNFGKLKEIKTALKNFPVEIFSLADFENIPDVVEDGKTFEENARIKAKYFSEKTGLACIADDSGLEVDALNGAPGVFSARFAGYHAEDGINNKKLLEELEKISVEESAADYRCALCFIDTDGTEILTTGIIKGKIKKIPQGAGGFGYDPYFYIDEKKTMAELSPEEKDSISHRGEALRKMISNEKFKIILSNISYKL